MTCVRSNSTPSPSRSSFLLRVAYSGMPVFSQPSGFPGVLPNTLPADGAWIAHFPKLRFLVSILCFFVCFHQLPHFLHTSLPAESRATHSESKRVALFAKQRAGNGSPVVSILELSALSFRLSPLLSVTCRLLPLSLQRITPSFRLFSTAYRLFLKNRGWGVHTGRNARRSECLSVKTSEAQKRGG
jgi:hypothetical protein